MPLPQLTLTRRVEFRDTDAAGIVHFSSFFLYMEQAEHELLRQLGLSVHQKTPDGVISWPRVSASCDYQLPAKFEELISVSVSVAKVGRKSVTYAFRFTRGEDQLATGEITTVCCRLQPGQPPQSIFIPADMQAKLRGEPT